MDATRCPEPSPVAQPTDWNERRRHPREPIFTAGIIFPDGRDEPEQRRSIYVFNVSCGGVGFRSQTCFTVGTIHGVHIGAGPLHLSARITIVSCRPRPDGTCDIGAEFL